MDGTRGWVAWQRLKPHALSIALGIALFIAGWQTGRVMSPYYAANPIVFQDTAATVASAGKTTELVALREAGQALAHQDTPATTPKAPAPAVAAAQTIAPKAEAEQSGDKLYVGSVNSDLYHHRDCPSAATIKVANQVWFASPEEAEAAGYSASKCTLQKLGKSDSNKSTN